MASFISKDTLKKRADEILVKKFFALDGLMNVFSCKKPSQEGQFIPEAMVFMVDGDEIAAFQKIGRAHVRTPVTSQSRMPSSA